MATYNHCGGHCIITVARCLEWTSGCIITVSRCLEWTSGCIITVTVAGCIITVATAWSGQVVV